MNIPLKRISEDCQEGHHGKCTVVSPPLSVPEWHCICDCHSDPNQVPIPSIPNRPSPPTEADDPQKEMVMAGAA